MDRKKAPHKLQVEDSKIDDNSVVEMTQAKMDELKIFKGDTVILKGKMLNQVSPLLDELLSDDETFPLNVIISVYWSKLESYSFLLLYTDW